MSGKAWRVFWRSLALLGVTGLALLILSARYDEVIADYRLKPLDNKPHLAHPKKTDRLATGVSVTQPVDWSRLQPHSLARFGDRPLCLSFYFATFGNADNMGVLDVVIDGEAQTAEAEVFVDELRDNRFHAVCFDALSLEAIARQPATVTITGRDSPAEQAVALWQDRENAGGEPFIVHRLLVKRPAPEAREDAYALLAIVSFTIAVLLMAAWRRP